MHKIITVILIFFLLYGCGANKEDNNRSAAPPPQQMNTDVKQNGNNDAQINSDEERANYLANLAKRIPNVNNATAVVLGQYAIIGIDVDQDLERTEVGSIKYSVSESIKHDPQGAGAIVVADPDLNARIKEVRDDIEAGKPVQGILNELADIVGRVIPSLPPPEGSNPEEGTEKPKKELNKEEQKTLEKEQQDQSNFHK